MFYEKLRELSDFRQKKRNEQKRTKDTSLGKKTGLFTFVYNTGDTIKCKLNELMNKFMLKIAGF